MTDFYASPARLRQAAGTADAAATALKGMHPARGLDRVAAAMPGSRAALTADSVGETLERTTSAAARAIEGYADALRTAATTFQATDRQEACRVESAGTTWHPPEARPLPYGIRPIIPLPAADPFTRTSPSQWPDAPTAGGR